ncbi:MAG: hypothetical protein WC435_00960 [Candidatus Paceibacterota bacterium]
MISFSLMLAILFSGSISGEEKGTLPSCFSVQSKTGWREDTKVNLTEKSLKYAFFLRDTAMKEGLGEKDLILLGKAAETESGWKQYDENGNVLRGENNPRVVGIFQICEDSHKREAKKMGLDIMTPKGNIKYAVFLYKKERLRPWRTNRKLMNFIRNLG